MNTVAFFLDKPHLGIIVPYYIIGVPMEYILIVRRKVFYAIEKHKNRNYSL